MIQRLYVHNFRCLENFDLRLADKPSVLLIGKNGSGKSTVGAALEVLQSIGRGTNRVGQLFSLLDFAKGDDSQPIRIEVEVLLQGVRYEYQIAVELPTGFNEMRILEEKLTADSKTAYSRNIGEVHLRKQESLPPSQFVVDWHLVALTLIQVNSDHPLHIFRTWLAQMLILAPVPALITGDSTGESQEPNRQVSNYGDWFFGLIAQYPRAYYIIDQYLREIIPDFGDITNSVVGRDTRAGRDFRSLEVSFSSDKDRSHLKLPFQTLSDGEKCYVICATVLAMNQTKGSVFCFWDEPDNYISIDEVGQFVMAMRRSFQHQGQLLLSSHNSEVVRHFSSENTLLLGRRSHQDPTRFLWLDEAQWDGDLVNALRRNEIVL